MADQRLRYWAVRWPLPPLSHSAFGPQKLRTVFKSNHLDLWYSDTRTIAFSRMMSFSMRIFRPCSWCARS